MINKRQRSAALLLLLVFHWLGKSVALLLAGVLTVLNVKFFL